MSRTAGTIEYTDIQGHLLPMSTPATRLARIGRIDFDELASSFCRFGVQLGKESRPRGICNAFRKTMVVGHAVHLQVLHADDPIGVDDCTACLVGEVLPSPGDTLMHTGDRLAVLPPVSGGEDERGDIFEITREPIDIARLRSRLLKGDSGAVVVFDGQTGVRYADTALVASNVVSAAREVASVVEEAAKKLQRRSTDLRSRRSSANRSTCCISTTSR